jgi:hypothetical protein
MWSLSHILSLGMVPRTGPCTITGAWTFTNTTEIQAIFAGARTRVLTRGAGSSQPLSVNSDCYITTDGAITIPISTGWRCWMELGGDHDISFNSTTIDVSAEGWGTGDILRVIVKSATVCKVWREVAAADLGAFA